MDKHETPSPHAASPLALARSKARRHIQDSALRVFRCAERSGEVMPQNQEAAVQSAARRNWRRKNFEVLASSDTPQDELEALGLLLGQMMDTQGSARIDSSEFMRMWRPGVDAAAQLRSAMLSHGLSVDAFDRDVAEETKMFLAAKGFDPAWILQTVGSASNALKLADALVAPTAPHEKGGKDCIL